MEIGKLRELVSRHDEIADMLSGNLSANDRRDLGKEMSLLLDVVDNAREILDLEDNLTELQYSESDDEWNALVDQEKERITERLLLLNDEIDATLKSAEEVDHRNAIIEIRPGTGGEEAALFANDLLKMYQGYTLLSGRKFEVMNISFTEFGGVRDAIIMISGKGAFAKMQNESGGHRVQRIPVTESSGRIHTSSASVAVLPEVEEIDVVISNSDLRIDVYRSSGPGGQSVNTTDSAVRITHIPTGIVVSIQDEKSQHKNKAKAMKILHARLYQIQQEEEKRKRIATVKDQIGSRGRSERIRTYNFPQNRVTDHRLNKTAHNLPAVLSGENLNIFIDAEFSEE